MKVVAVDQEGKQRLADLVCSIGEWAGDDYIMIVFKFSLYYLTSELASTCLHPLHRCLTHFVFVTALPFSA